MQKGAELRQLANLSAAKAPLFPVAQAHPASQPVVEFRDGPIQLRYPEVTHPAAQILCQLEHPVVHGNTPAPPGQLLDALFETRQYLV